MKFDITAVRKCLKLFDFFDDFRWHLDERPLRADNEINPDVVGYIFEKYINQKLMGAYYTKEDITEYISKNTIIPFLFDAAEKKCPIAFAVPSPSPLSGAGRGEELPAIWQLLRDDPDRYIYPAVGHGVTCDYDRVNHLDHQPLAEPRPLPAEIEAGVHDVAKRGGWKQTAPEEYGLPTETWREVVARRNRCLELREKLKAGEVHAINDLVTSNLDIWQFARDAIVTSEGPELLRAFWHAIEKVTVLGPTCGSGAFLFAALRILESLYSDCLERMRRFVEDRDEETASPSRGAARRLEKYRDFKAVLARALSPRTASGLSTKSTQNLVNTTASPPTNLTSSSTTTSSTGWAAATTRRIRMGDQLVSNHVFGGDSGADTKEGITKHFDVCATGFERSLIISGFATIFADAFAGKKGTSDP